MRYVATLAALGIASAALLAVAAPEGREGRAPGMERLKQADTNGDGLISREEAKALPRLAARFDEIDTNHDGKLDTQERAAWREKQREHYRQQAADRSSTVNQQH